MNFTKILLPVCIAILGSLYTHAQQSTDYSNNWKAVEAFEKKGLTKSALQEVMKVFDLATAARNESQQVKAAMYQMKYRNMVEEDNKENNIFYIDTLIAKTKSPAKNILQSMQAELFRTYRDNNRYKLYNRTQLTSEKSKDITTWSIEKLNKTIAGLYKSSLKNESVLKTTSLNGLDAIIQKGENTRNLRPTVYDFLVHRALSYFMSSENDITSPSYKFILNDERIFSPVAEFVKVKFATKDSTSLYYNALILFQDISKFHLNDATPEALLDDDLIRLNFANDHGIFYNKEKLYEDALKSIETVYSKNSGAAEAMYLRAVLYYTRGQGYDAVSKKDNQYDIKRARELCDSIISNYPKSRGAVDAQNLSKQIKRPSLNIETEKVNVIDQPFRSLAKYKNINTLYLRIVKTTREEIQKINESGYDVNWNLVTNLKPVKSWNINLPNLQDYQQHATEIKIDALPSGTYFILASINADFSLKQNIIARQITYISDISYILNNKDELYVLNRDNGLPFLNASVQVWQRTYNYTTRKYEEFKKEKYSSDANGYIKLKRSSDGYNNSLQVKYNKDELFLDDNISTYYYNDYEIPAISKTFLFTDRSIYRPGQTIFFKGIVVNTDSASKKSSIIPGYKTAVILFDANNQQVNSVNVQAGEYGSFNGSFKLPEGLLNGQFYLKDSANSSTQYLSVEEYKRPKFFVEVKKPSGTYSINDSITVKGTAKAYAGNNIDGGKITYRVVRKISWPVWWNWGGYYTRGKRIYPGGNEEMEIANGVTTTNSAGEFSIVFKAIPDETVDKKGQPVFHYEVTTDITDINGETRSGNTTVAVAYQALQLTISSPDKIEADSIKNIKISSTNMNGLFEKATVHVALYKLRSPQRIFRERFWDIPDQFMMSYEEYKNNFPYDVYSDEDKVNKWPLGINYFDKTDTTSENGKFSIRNGQLGTGWYKLIATTKDKYGEEVSAEKYIQLTDGNGFVAESKSAISVTAKNDLAEPGGKISYRISTDFDKLWLIHYLGKPGKSNNTTYQTITSGLPFTNEINITENDRGGININYAFVQHNRVYNGSQYFNVPWSNKDLTISYETFRDKILPGSEEKWKIKISGSKTEKVAAETLISMYDASLDQFKPHNWVSLKSLWPCC